MFREQRVQDLADCGSTGGGLKIDFPPEKKKEASTQLVKLANGKFTTDGDGNLFKKLISCMESKGYHQVLLSQCGGYKKEDNEVCMYP